MGALALAASLAAGLAVELKSDAMVALPAGLYMPFLRVKALNASNADAAAARRIDAFRLDTEPVTNAQFLEFVTAHPQWRKSRIRADGRYLKRWPSELELAGAEARDEPVTNVSWFAAEAYCKGRGLRLPTTEQWEYALTDDGRGQEAVRARWNQQQRQARHGLCDGGEDERLFHCLSNRRSQSDRAEPLTFSLRTPRSGPSSKVSRSILPVNLNGGS